MSLTATLEQDRAAGGADRRKMRIRSGEIVVVSLAVNGASGATSASITMRFKSGGLTVGRPVGKVEGDSRFELLKRGWEKVREDRVAEQNHWSWVVD